MSIMASIIILLICIPFISALLIFIGGRRTERDLGLGAFIASILTVPLLLPLIAYIQSNESYAFTLIESSRYLPFTVGFMVDSLSLILLIAISVLSTLAILYSLAYVKGMHDVNSYYAGILIFMGGMIGVVLASDMILFYLFWEMVLVASWALVTYWGETGESYRIGLKYFFFTHVGAILILLGILWVYSLTGSTSMYGLTYDSSATFSILKTIAIFFVVGFGIKMAIFPFHSWLPDAHTVAQLPVTIMLAAIMLSTGAYGLMRFLFNVLPDGVGQSLIPYTLILAVITQFYGAIMALVEKDIKRILGYSSVSQMGYMFFGICSCVGLGAGGSIFHVINHGMAKALLFMVIGAVAHAAGTRNIDQLGGLAKKMPLTALACIIGAFSIAGAPPFAGFQSEWMILSSGFGIEPTTTLIKVISMLSVCAAVFTTGYALWLVMRVFFGPPKSSSEKQEAKDPSFCLMFPMLILSVASILIGIFPSLFMPLVKASVKVLEILL